MKYNIWTVKNTVSMVSTYTWRDRQFSGTRLRIVLSLWSVLCREHVNCTANFIWYNNHTIHCMLDVHDFNEDRWWQCTFSYVCFFNNIMYCLHKLMKIHVNKENNQNAYALLSQAIVLDSIIAPSYAWLSEGNLAQQLWIITS